MKKIILALLLVPQTAAAQISFPVDRPCLPWEDAASNNCIPITPALGTDDAEFYQMVAQYWACRRPFETEDVIPYAGCIDSVLKFKLTLGDTTPTLVRTDILRYYDVIPALPIVEAPGDMMNAKLECIACQASRRDARAALAACSIERDRLMNLATGQISELRFLKENYTFRRRRRR